MAHFRGTVRGSRGEASRLGTKNSGLDVTANGWGIGASISMGHSKETDTDYISLWITHGSRGGGNPTYLGNYHKKDGRLEKV